MSNRQTSSNMEEDIYEMPKETENEDKQNTEARAHVYEGLQMEQPKVEARKCEVSKKTRWCLGVVSLLLCIMIAAIVTGFILLYQNIEAKISQSKQEMNNLQQQNMEKLKNESEKQYDLLQDEMNKARSLTAFHVYMDKGLIYADSGDVIPFNKVITNIGDGFNTTTHKFRCPVSGVYAFWFSLYTGALSDNGKQWTTAELTKDGSRLSWAFCRNEGSDAVFMMCSNQAVTECQAGSQVWVQCRWSDVTLYGTSTRETTFSGFLLKQN